MNVLSLLAAEPPVRVEAVDGDGSLTLPGRAALVAQAFGYVFVYLYALANVGLALSDGVLGFPYGFWAGGFAARLWARAKSPG